MQLSGKLAEADLDDLQVRSKMYWPKFILADDGVKCNGPNGAMGFHPWRNFSRWREGKRVVLIDQSQGGGFVILPVADLSEIERESIRGILKAHLPPLP